MEKIRPFLKWAGNKYRGLDHILTKLPPGSRLIEPFTGSGAVFVNAKYKHYLLAEKNKDLIGLYKQLQLEGIDFIDYCQEYFTPANNCAPLYYKFRDKFNQCINTREKAAIFLFLNRHGYNGLCRYNQQGGYNVPFGDNPKPYFPRKEMLHFHIKSQNAKFMEKDFQKTFAMATPGDVIYCDPPYVPLSKTANFLSYTKQGFGEQEQITLALLAKQAASLNIRVIISNHDTPFTRDLYKDAEKLYTFPITRLISCKAELRLPAQEILAVF